MWPTNWSPIEKEASGMLLSCHGLIGQAWSYSTSHSQLLVRFYREGSDSGIYLYCKDCDSIQFEGSWRQAMPTVELSPSQFPGRVTIKDGERLSVICGAAFLAESSVFVRLPEPRI